MAEQGFGRQIHELIEALRKLPPEMQGKASGAIERESSDMESAVKNGYSDAIKFQGTGNLVRGVGRRRKGSLSTTVHSRAPHVHLFEFGSYKSGERFWKKAPKSTGTMPAANIFIPLKWRHLRQLQRRYEDILKQARVKGMTGSAT